MSIIHSAFINWTLTRNGCPFSPVYLIFSYLFVSLGSREYLFYSTGYTLLPLLLIAVLSCPRFDQWKLLQAVYYVFSTSPYCVLNAYLLFATTRYFRLDFDCHCLALESTISLNHDSFTHPLIFLKI